MLHRLIKKEKIDNNHISDEFQYINLIKYILDNGREIKKLYVFLEKQ